MTLSTRYYQFSDCRAKNPLFRIDDIFQMGEVLFYQDTLPVEFAFDQPRNIFNF